jgi:GNAT superfamily N-acetyltransferase
MLGTHPAHQRRGAADLQLRWATEVADKKGVACWVEASPASVPLYEKHGFVFKGEVVCSLHESCGGGTYTYTSMLREPNVN